MSAIATSLDTPNGAGNDGLGGGHRRPGGVGVVQRILYGLLVLVPVAVALEVTGWGGHTAIFVVSAAALVPLAAVLGRATEEAAVYTGPKIGALLNATLGNAAELIITVVALREGLVSVVKASIAGSIVGNVLVVLGASLLLGGLKNGTQRFDPRVAGTNATMMTLAVAALAIPAVFALGAPEHRPSEGDIEFLSDGVAVVLIVIYALYLLYSLVQKSPGEEAQGHHGAATMPLRTALAVLGVATVAIVFMSEFLVGALEPTAEDWGLSPFFVGVIVVPLVGNVAEHLVAVQVAVANKMDLGLGIAVGSSLQIALFVTPLLVFAGMLFDQPMTLVFNPFELTALIAAALIAVLISVDGESNWLEGAELLALYLILGIAFFVLP